MRNNSKGKNISFKPLKIFFSYSHENNKLRDRLEIHLSFLKRENQIKTWHDGEIFPGQNIDTEIKNNLENADVILLLISPDFINSEYCWEVEMKSAMERHYDGKAIVIPIIGVPTSGWQEAPFGKLKALPEDGKAISSWTNIEEAFFNVAEGIKNRILFQKGNPGNIIWSIKFKGPFDEFSKEKEEAIHQTLMEITGGYIKFLGKKSGSVQLIFRSSPLVLNSLKNMHKKRVAL